MTWVVGTPTMFGYGIGISDIRVTLGDGTEVDCLQKMYPVARWMAAAFAGSVKIGFAMIDMLSQMGNAIEEPYAIVPTVMAREWPSYARRVFEKFSDGEREHACHLMLISADPEEDNGNPNWPRCYVHIFRSPDFEPEEIPVHRLGSIGSGNSYNQCSEIVDTFSSSLERRFFHMEQGMGNEGGIATSIGHDLTDVLKRSLPPGISPHLHYCWVYRGAVIIEANNHVVKGPWTMSPLGHTQDQFDDRDEVLDEGATAFRMPLVAQNWHDLEEFLKRENLDASGAIA